MKSFKIALAQFSPFIGDIESNVQKMIEQANDAKKQNAEIVVFPELSIIGYPAEDLLLRPSLPIPMKTCWLAAAARFSAPVTRNCRPRRC